MKKATVGECIGHIKRDLTIQSPDKARKVL